VLVVDLALRPKVANPVRAWPPVEKSSKRTQGFYGAKMPSKGYPFENVAPFVYCNDTGRLPPVRAGAGNPELPSTWLDTAVRATATEALSRKFTRETGVGLRHLRGVQEEDARPAGF